MAGTRSVSATASAVLHAAALLTLMLVMRLSQDAAPAPSVAVMLPRDVVWLPHDAAGGGRDGGGQRSPDPPRQMRAVGRDASSAITNAQSPSIDATIEPPEDVPALPAQPIGDAMQIVPGVIASSGISAGPGDSSVGTSTGPGQGRGNNTGDGFSNAYGVGGPGVTAPTLIERVAPKYTVEAMQARIQGIAFVECVVQVDGTVTDARIMRSLDRRFGLDEEALKAARRWRFRPGLLHGKPVPVVITIELMFTVR